MTTATLHLCPPSLDLCFTRGDTLRWTFEVKEADGTTPVDITGFSFLLTVDPSSEPTDASGNLFQLTGTLLTPASGIVAFEMSPSQADRVGVFFYDLQMTDAGSRIRTILKGAFQFDQDITKT